MTKSEAETLESFNSERRKNVKSSAKRYSVALKL